jgi:hypothetical protein
VEESCLASLHSRRVIASREEKETTRVVRCLNHLLHSLLGISRPCDSAHFLKCHLHNLLHFSGVAVPLYSGYNAVTVLSFLNVCIN